MTCRRILGVDPGLNTTGYAVLEHAGGRLCLCEAGVVRSRAKAPLPDRLDELYQGICDVIQSQQPEVMALEQLFSHYQRPRTAILMGHARGVICLAAGRAEIPVTHFEPTRVKKVLTGNGRAPKHQMQVAVRLQLGLQRLPEPADVADAMAIALCGHHLGTGAEGLSSLSPGAR